MIPHLLDRRGSGTMRRMRIHDFHAGPRFRRHAALLAVIAQFAIAPAGLAQYAPPTSFADTASAVVRDAASSAWHTTRDLTSSALGLIGIRYKWGGATPESGLDCSGLVQFVFQQVTGVTLPRSAKELSRIGEQVTRSDLQPGDLVFFNTRRFAFSHVGIYVGDNRFIHAPRRGREVEVATIDDRYWQKHFNGARRLIGVLPEMMPKLIADAEASSPVAAVSADLPDELATGTEPQP
jgi:cell wall-associated NlpC family hydrolase